MEIAERQKMESGQKEKGGVTPPSRYALGGASCVFTSHRTTLSTGRTPERQACSAGPITNDRCKRPSTPARWPAHGMERRQQEPHSSDDRALRTRAARVWNGLSGANELPSVTLSHTSRWVTATWTVWDRMRLGGSRIWNARLSRNKGRWATRGIQTERLPASKTV